MSPSILVVASRSEVVTASTTIATVECPVPGRLVLTAFVVVHGAVLRSSASWVRGFAFSGFLVWFSCLGVAFEFSAGRNTVTYGFSRSLAGLWLRVFPAGSRLLRFLRRSCQICCECILAPESETENLMHDFWDASVDSAVRCNAMLTSSAPIFVHRAISTSRALGFTFRAARWRELVRMLRGLPGCLLL